MRSTSASAFASSKPVRALDWTSTAELVALELAVALERDAIDDLRALGDGDDHLAVDDLRAHLREHAGRREVGDGAIDARLVGAGEIRTNRRRVGVASALDDDVLGGNLRRRRRRKSKARAPSQGDREQERAKISAKQMHLARRPRFATGPNGPGLWRAAPCGAPRVLADSRLASKPARSPAAGRATCLIRFYLFCAPMQTRIRRTLDAIRRSVAREATIHGRPRVNCRRRRAAKCRATW